MKIKAMILGALLGTIFMVGTSYAVVADGWYGCTATAVGPDSGRVFVQLTACSGPTGASEPGWVVLSTESTDQMLATFLTAMSLDRPVSVHINSTWTDPSGYAYSRVVGLQMAQAQ